MSLTIPACGPPPTPRNRCQPTWCAWVLAVAVGCPVLHAADPGASLEETDFQRRSRTLFDGDTMAGWEGKGYWFRVEEGAIVAGRLEQAIPQNEFLATTEQFDDFDLRMEVRLRGQGRNAGVQFRSRRPLASDEAPANEMIGYQADMGQAGGRSVWGALYDESRRRRMLALPDPPVEMPRATTPASDPANSGGTAKTAVSQTPWVRLRIVCRGPRVQIYLDDTLTVDYTETDPEIPRVGVIGLQIHSGPPAEAWYRNLRILSL